jgi:hypothetical protein
MTLEVTLVNLDVSISRLASAVEEWNNPGSIELETAFKAALKADQVLKAALKEEGIEEGIEPEPEVEPEPEPEVEPEKPKAKTKAKAKAKKEPELPSARPEPEGIDKETVRAALGEVQETHGVASAKEILSEFDAPTIGKLDSDDYQEVLDRCAEVLESGSGLED